jgi:hypothetical protein
VVVDVDVLSETMDDFFFEEQWKRNMLVIPSVARHPCNSARGGKDK